MSNIVIRGPERGACEPSGMPFPWSGFRRTAILEWNVGSAPSGRLLVSKNGGPATLFAEGSQGTGSAPWIVSGNRYAFRLYAGRRLVA